MRLWNADDGTLRAELRGHDGLIKGLSFNADGTRLASSAWEGEIRLWETEWGTCVLRLRGHACTIFEAYKELGGMMVFGIPGYRTPRDVLQGEIRRITDMGVEVRLETRVGTDVSPAELERDYDAVLWTIGATQGKALPVAGAEAPNCIDGMSYLRAFNEGRLKYLTGRVLVVGAGDTAMDVVAVARRLGRR